MDIALVATVLSAAGFGTIVGGVLARGKDRRDARAAALKAINAVERARWAPREWDEFIGTVRDAQVALLQAQVPQQLGRGYLRLAVNGYFLSSDSWAEQHQDDPLGAGMFAGPSLELLHDGLRVVVASLWHPWVGRTVGRLRMQRITRRAERQLGDGQELYWEPAGRNIP